MSPRDGLNRVLAALQNHGSAPSAKGGYHSARCPGHDDHSPSLSVQHIEAKAGESGGRARLRCHAGCDERDVLAAIGLGFKDLYDEPIPARSRGAIREFPYLSGSDRVIGVVQRHPTTPDGKKPFLPLTMNGAGGWQQSSSDELKTTPYRLPELVAAIDRGDPVWVVEGERDADTLAAHGITATCNAGGAGKWTGAHARWLTGADVTICRDRDEPGRGHAEKVAATLTGVAATVRLVEPAEGKDITEHLTAGRSLDELIEVEADATGRASPSAAADPCV